MLHSQRDFSTTSFGRSCYTQMVTTGISQHIIVARIAIYIAFEAKNVYLSLFVDLPNIHVSGDLNER